MNNEIMKLTNNLSLSYEIALAIGGTLDLKTMVEGFLKTVVRKGGAYRGFLWMIEDQQPCIINAVGSFTKGMDYQELTTTLKPQMKSALDQGITIIKTRNDDDFLDYCIPFTGNEKEVLLVPIGSTTVIQLFFTYEGASSQGFSGILEGVAPQLDNAILACKNHDKLLQMEKVEKQLLEKKHYELINNLDVGIFICDAVSGYFLDSNSAALKMLGYNHREELCQKTWYSVCDSDQEKLKTIIQKEGKIKSQEIVLKRKNGSIFWADLTAVIQPSQDDTYYIMGIVNDIDDRKKTEEKLRYLATYDPLTKIPNRYLLENKLKDTIIKSKDGKNSALMLIDVDNFKLVNDTLGHDAGDELVVQLTRVLRSNIGEKDFLARIGGDEFAVITEGLSKNEVLEMAERIRHLIYEHEITIKDNYKFNLTVSVGIVLINGTVSYQKVLAKADTALYKSKEEGRNKVTFISASEDSSSHFIKVVKLINDIKMALKEDQFILLMQPVVDINERQIIHHEALIRLKYRNGELLSPGEFIPVAEQFGLMSQIDYWVFKTALKKLAEYPDLTLFINVSAVSLAKEDLLKRLERDILNSDIHPNRIGFEITETSLMKDLAMSEKWIIRLQKMGCRFALDDFGVGFSSMSYLLNLSVDYIKIDGSFIKKIHTDPTHCTLVDAMNKLAYTLGKRTIAEFVENEEIVDVLRMIGINLGQGYFFGRPQPEPITINNEELRLK
ncbi:MAG: EAL domain-containing protein [Firmicutes bacterium]|nr:EAL domain-containing protein [Bacillota bacterium]